MIYDDTVYHEVAVSGSLPQDVRNRTLDEVNDPNSKYRVFLLSTSCCCTGIDMSQAVHAVIVDEWWNPADEAQAVDRIFRLG
jgi:SNF2 family DNA or RNA helicase